MATSLFGVIKGLLLQREDDRSKQLSIEVGSGATTGTRTTITAAQTANRTITLPDSSTTLVGQDTLDNIEGDLQDQIDDNAAAIAAHISDTTGAHTASAITNVPSGNLTATDIQAAVNELQDEIDTFSGGNSNPFLSNLQSPTAINQHLLPGSTDAIDLGASTVNRFRNIWSQQLDVGNEIYAGDDHGNPAILGAAAGGETSLYTPSGVAAPYFTADGRPVAVFTRNNSDNTVTATTDLLLETGNKTVGTANSGNVAIRTGTSTATRGKIQLKDGTEGTAGHVWTSTDTSGSGAWAAGNLGKSSVRGARGGNNSVTPASQYDLNADSICLTNSVNVAVIRNNPGVITNNISTAGPAANGRDQVGAFTNPSWVHFYWIWNGTTLATLSSASPPSTGPTLPSGYTHWAYACAVYYFGSLQTTYLAGSSVFPSIGNFGSGFAATTATNISLAGVIPPNALSYELRILGIILSTGGGIASARLQLLTPNNDIRGQTEIELTGLGASQVTTTMNASITMPNFNNNLRYQWQVISGSSQTAQFQCTSYKIPNGGE